MELTLTLTQEQADLLIFLFTQGCYSHYTDEFPEQALELYQKLAALIPDDPDEDHYREEQELIHGAY